MAEKLKSGKVRIQRASETPVTSSDGDAFRAEWTVLFDKAESRADEKGLNPQQRMDKLQRYLAFYETQLKKKYKLWEEVDMPKSAKAWADLVALHGSAIMVATAARNPKEIVLVIVDAPI